MSSGRGGFDCQGHPQPAGHGEGGQEGDPVEQQNGVPSANRRGEIKPEVVDRREKPAIESLETNFNSDNPNKNVLGSQSERECVVVSIETSNSTNKFDNSTEKSFDSETPEGVKESNTTENHLGAEYEGVTETLKKLDDVE